MTEKKKPGPKPRPFAERFWGLVDQRGPDECWPWQGHRIAQGYGKAQDGTRKSQAHRFAYELSIGPIPEGLVIDHLCRNRACCNPAHLDPVPQGENLRRGDHANRGKTHCKRGHPFDAANTIVWADGLRRCRACRTARTAPSRH